MRKVYLKIISLLLTVLMLFALCSCTGEPTNDAQQTPDPTPTSGEPMKPISPYDEVQTVTWARVADSTLKTQALEFLLLNFGLKINERHLESQNMNSSILQMYSANIAPELATGISVNMVKTLAERGYLCELYSQKESLENYFALWDSWQDGWEYTQGDIICSVSDSDEEGLYCLVPVNRKASRAWIYNKTLFENNSMEFPSTLNELYETLARYKASHTTSPAIWTNQNEALQFTAILNAYGLTDDVWQTDKNGNVFYLYAQKEWYEALEWLTKFEKLSIVPVDENGVLKSCSSKEYAQITEKSYQIIEFCDSYNYLYIQSEQKGNPEWAVADVMIAADENTTPVLNANTPYLNEATCIASSATASERKQILAFIDWCCTNEGNMWANFGSEGVGYRINENGEFVFLKYYSDEVTRDISAKDAGSISDITVGRMFTTVPWDEINISNVSNRYSAEEKFLASADVRLVFPERFSSLESAIEDKTKLWEYTQISNRLKELTDHFVEFSRENGFSDYFWNKYYQSLLDAGLEEYEAIMQKRKQ